jgi:ABC-type multidrug transport system fused ATPase/permease subunit
MVLVGMISIMLVIDWQLTLMAIFTVPALMFSIATYTRKIKASTIRARHKEGKVASIAHESLQSISMIQAFSLEEQQSERFSEYNKSNLRAGLRTRKLIASFQRLVEILLALGSCVVMWFGVQKVLDGILSPGDLIVFISYMRDMYRPLRKLSQLTSRVGKATACGERILEILDMKPIIRSSRKAIVAPPFIGKIHFNDVNFSYNGNDQTLRDIDFTIDPGQTVALVGPSGTGKTTILNLLLRFYEPQKGGIEIDGYNIRKITIESLRKQISVIMHEPYLFGTTVWENIAMGKPEATFEEIERAARIANAHEFIIDMEKGYETVLSESGSILSRGQQQRIALARTAIRETPIIILDEPTTGLDAKSELLVIDTLNKLMRDRTCIIIVHRFSTIKSSDRILVLDKGKIIEDGDHNTLMQTSSRYKELYSLQATQNSENRIHGDIL